MTSPGGNVQIDCVIEVDDNATPAIKNLNKELTKSTKLLDQVQKKIAKQQQKSNAFRNKNVASSPQAMLLAAYTTMNAAMKQPGKQAWTSNLGNVMPPGRSTTNIPQLPAQTSGASRFFEKSWGGNNVHGVYGRGGTEKDSGYVPIGFSGKGKSVDKIQKTFGSIGESNSKIQKWNKSFFKFQMATLGLSFSFMGLESTVTNLVGKLGDLSGAFTSNAYGKVFGGVDVAAASGTSNAALVEAWKNFQGIMGMVDTALRVVAANMLTPEVMAAIAKFFQDLAPVAPQLGKALGDVLLNAIKFLDALIPLVPIISSVLDVLSPILGPIGVMIILLGSLLPLLSTFGYIFAAIEVVATIIAPLAGAIVGLFAGISAPMILIAGVALVLIDFFVNLWKAFSDGGDIISNFYQALWMTWQDIAALIKTITLGVIDLTSKSGTSTSTSTNTTNNTYNIANLNTNSDISTAAKSKARA